VRQLLRRAHLDRDGDAEAPRASYDVVVDGRRLSWEEFGRALEPFEGWDFTLRIHDDEFVDSGVVAASSNVVQLPDAEPAASPEDTIDAGLLSDLDEEEFFRAWDEAEAGAVDLLRRSLPELIDEDPPAGALASAADRLRAGMKNRTWPYDNMRRAADFEAAKLPKSNLELWVAAAGSFIAMRGESGLDVEVESSLMTLEHADWLGAILGLVRAGVGASAEPEALVRYVDECPEVEGDVDPEEAFLVEGGFELALPSWEAAGAIDADHRLTPLGRWGLPRALAWAWNGDFDDGGET